jgi:flagellar hook-associated protein 1 FlgK
MPLVLLTHPFHLETYQVVKGDLPTIEVRFEQDQAPLMATGGTLAATREARDDVLASYMGDLDRLAAELIYEFNRLHVQGVGTAPLTSAVSTEAAVDPAAELGRLDLGFTPVPGTFRVVNGSVTVSVVALGSGQITEFTVPVDADGVGADDSLNDFVTAFNAAAPAGTVAASVDAAGHLRFDSADPSAWGFYFTGDSSGLLATMGVNTFWTGHGAATMDVNPVILADERLLATGKTTASGDTDNLLEMIALREQSVAASGTKTFDEFYRSVVGRLGTEAQRVNDRQALHSDLAMRLENERQAVSGVSLDEEMTRMIQFQRAYQAAARVITVSDAMLDTLINM